MQQISLKKNRSRSTAIRLLALVAVLLFFCAGTAMAKEKKRSEAGTFVISKKTSSSQDSVRLKVVPAWTKKLGTKTPWGMIKKIGGHGNSSRPAVYADTLYIGAAKKIFYAFDLGSGDLRWKFKTRSMIDGDVAANGDMVCFGTVAGVLHCLDRNTGKELWSFNAHSEIIAAPVISERYIYFTSTEDRVYALDRKSGKKIWSYSAFAPHYVMPRVVSSPILRDTDVGRRIFMLLANGSITCLNADRGKEVWSKKVITLKINAVERARRRVEGNKTELFVINDRGIVVVFDHKDGKIKKSYPIIKTIDFVVSGDKIYLLGEELLVAVERKSGKVLWSTTLDHGKPSVLELSGEYLIVVSAITEVPFKFKYLAHSYGYASAYSATTGNESWSKKFKRPITAINAAGAKTLALVNSKGVLRVFNLEQ